EIPSNVNAKTNAISETHTFYDTYNPTKQGGVYTAPSQEGIWTKQP
ncbi:MAG: hypothetical protein GX032_00905, partial [Tenericutes bacterium]|nr:hypothetical protein [Mycoplasmatota bacterium]